MKQEAVVLCLTTKIVEESKLIVELFVKYNTAQSKDRTESNMYVLYVTFAIKLHGCSFNYMSGNYCKIGIRSLYY